MLAIMTNLPSKSALDLSFGIEEEFFLIDPFTRNLPCRPPASFFKACRMSLGSRVGEEMLQPQVELATPVLTDAVQARQVLTEFRGELGRLASRHSLGVIASGTHPFAAWHSQQHTQKPRYEELIDDFQIVGRRNLFCGLHVHVGVPEGFDRVVLMNRLMKWLPMFLAMSASSPLWLGRATGLHSYRQAAYDEWPRSGIPDAFADELEYSAFVRLLASCGALRDGSSLWWAIRPSARYSTLELRITDACTHVDDSLALASAFRCLVRCHLRNPDLGVTRSPITRRIIDENRWRAKRYGTDAEFIDEATGTAQGFHATLAEFMELVSEDASELGCEREIAQLWTILERGTSAHSQMALFRDVRDPAKAMVQVVDWLAQATTSAHASQILPVELRQTVGDAAIA
jgi:carboxylate-amine ligase